MASAVAMPHAIARNLWEIIELDATASRRSESSGCRRRRNRRIDRVLELELRVAAPQLRGDRVRRAQRIPDRLELIRLRQWLAVDREQDIAGHDIDDAERSGAIDELHELPTDEALAIHAGRDLDLAQKISRPAVEHREQSRARDRARALAFADRRFGTSRGLRRDHRGLLGLGLEVLVDHDRPLR